MPILPLINKNLTSGSVLAKSTLFNLIGLIAPIGVAVFTIPILVRLLGVERFGILSLIWLVIGYFSLFDLGLGRALTRLVAANIHKTENRILATETFTALSLMVSLGTIGAAAMALCSSILVKAAFKIPFHLQTETHRSLILLSLSVPVVIFTTGLRGILEAYQEFGVINAIRVPMGVFNFLAPLAVLTVTNSLPAIVVVLLLGRIGGCAIHFWFCLKVMPELLLAGRLRISAVPALLRFGSWLTVSNIIGPLMSSVDRLFISGMVSIAAVAYYTTPQEVVSRTGTISAAIAAVLFPAFATSIAQSTYRAEMLFQKGLKYTFLVMFPLTISIIMMGKEGLNIWLGKDFSIHSARVLQIQCIAVFISCFVQVPFALIQGAGKPRITALIQLLELPIFIPMLLYGVRHWGIEGAAWVWVLRMGVELIALFWAVHHFVKIPFWHFEKHAVVFGTALILLALAGHPAGLIIRISLLGFVLIAFTFIGWHRVLDSGDRAYLFARLNCRLRRNF